MKEVIENAIYHLENSLNNDNSEAYIEHAIDDLRQLLSEVENAEPIGWCSTIELCFSGDTVEFPEPEFTVHREKDELYECAVYLHPPLIKRLTKKEVMDIHHSIGYTKDILKSTEAIQTALIEKNNAPKD